MEKQKSAKQKEVFEKKPKESKKARPEPKRGKEEGLFEATEGEIKEGGLRKSLKVPSDYKFSRVALNKLKKHEVGEKFDFLGKSFKMTERLAKQIQLALNMMKK